MYILPIVWWFILHSTFSDFLNGAVLGACISTLSFPFSVAKVQMQKKIVYEPGLTVFKAITQVIK